MNDYMIKSELSCEELLRDSMANNLVLSKKIRALERELESSRGTSDRWKQKYDRESHARYVLEDIILRLKQVSIGSDK